MATPERHGIDGLKVYSDLEFLALEEIRFFASVTLALRPDRGMIYPYPLYLHLDTENEVAGADWILDQAREAVRAVRLNDFFSRGAVLPPIVGGPSYEFHEEHVDVAVLSAVLNRASLTDHLLMRGLGALLRADMLWRRHEFGEAAAMMLYVALDASFHLVLRALKEKGVGNPSADDAGAFIDQAFNPGIESGPFFTDYYEDRIKTLHPSSRYGIYPFAPLESDGFYDLRSALMSVYVFLICGYVWPNLWK